jgi:glutaconate CoA-transferase, subunit A
MPDPEGKLMTLEEAVSRYVSDGCSVAFGGIAGREPMAVSYELVRQRKRNLTFITATTCDSAEILIAGGCVSRVECAYIWVGVVGVGNNYRRAVEKGIPNYLEIKESSNFAMSMRFMAGALGLPFMPVKSLLGSDILTHNPDIKVMEDPYGSGPVALVPASRPDVVFIHVQRADTSGNAQIWGMLGNDDNLARAAKTVVITCEEVIPTGEIRKIPNMTAIPSYCVSAVVEAPFCSHPLPVSGYYWMDIPFRREMVAASKTREGIVSWMDEWIFGLKDFAAYKEKVGFGRLAKVQQMEFENYRIPHISNPEGIP